jgi:glycerol-3-phosphate acyltransferase PlsY
MPPSHLSISQALAACDSVWAPENISPVNPVNQALGLGLPQWLGLLGAYAVGCVNTGYYLVRWRTGQDLRAIGSGNAGAKNVGRILGPWGFAAALLGDMLKGALAMLGARLAGWPPGPCVLVLLAVTAGHNWPAQLGFRGGKGLATSFGSLLLFDPLLAGAMLVLCAALLVTTRRFTLSAAIPYAMSPALAVVCGYGIGVALLLVPLALLVVLPHRRELGNELTRGRTAAKP